MDVELVAEKPPGPSAPHWKARATSLFLGLQTFLVRHKGWLPIISFIGGIASFFLVERQMSLATGIIGMLLLSWLWFEMEGTVAIWVKRLTSFRLPTFLVSFAAQALHQEALFFVVPFLYFHTAWNTVHVVFSSIVLLLAIITVLDQLYFPLVENQLIRALVHGFVAFLAVFVSLPQVIHMTTAKSLRVACMVMAVLTLPAIYRSFNGTKVKRALAAILISLSVGGSMYLGRSLIPPTSLRLTALYPAFQLDVGTREAIPIRGTIPTERLKNGLWVFSAIQAPRGLKEEIFHQWYWNGKLVDQIILEVEGGREKGFRSWSKKDHFPDDPSGTWRVRVTTLNGQLLGNCEFQVGTAATRLLNQSR